MNNTLFLPAMGPAFAAHQRDGLFSLPDVHPIKTLWAQIKTLEGYVASLENRLSDAECENDISGQNDLLVRIKLTQDALQTCCDEVEQVK